MCRVTFHLTSNYDLLDLEVSPDPPSIEAMVLVFTVMRLE
jgi:hypothetical protein